MRPESILILRKKFRVVRDNVSDSLSVCSTSTTTTEDMIMNRSQLISHTISNVRACGCSGICTENHTVSKLDSHNSSLQKFHIKFIDTNIE